MAAYKNPDTLQGHIRAFVDFMAAAGYSPVTLHNYPEMLHYWRKYLDEKQIAALDQVTPQLAAGFQAWLYDYKSRFRRTLTITSQIGILSAVRMFYRFLVKTHRVLSDPSAAIQLPKVPQRLPASILTPREVKRLLAQPDTATVIGFRDRTMLEVLYSTGLRITEVLSLKTGDIDLDQNALRVRRGKGGKERLLPLGESAARYLVEYMKRVRPVLTRGRAGDHLFVNRLGDPLQKSGFCIKLHVYGQRAKLKKRITVHTFRHTLATEMLKRGADLRHIQEMLGHENLTTTQRYTHLVKTELRRVQGKFHPREQTEMPEAIFKYRGTKELRRDR
jgi:integrase/recombinase XerD